MPSAHRRSGRASVVAFAMLLAAFAVRCDLEDMDREQLYCENAVAQLVRCCPGFTVDQSYCYRDEGCSTAIYPAVDGDDARCIVRSSCASLVESGACARAMQPDQRIRDTSVCR